jgi:2-oxoglutarate dehydrogenase E2 component (dihydrolipoamide succinyltransferase)
MIIEIKVPSPGESINEVELSRKLVEDGDIVVNDQEIAEVDSDKATITIIAESSGKIFWNAIENQRLAVGFVIATIDTSFQPEHSEIEIKTTSKPSAIRESNIEKPYKISPLAKEVMAKNQLKIDDLKKFSSAKKILKKDILSILYKDITSQSNNNRPVEIIKMSMLRQKIAERLVAVKNQTAMLTTFNEVDLTEVIKIRETFKNEFLEVHGVKLSFMSFFSWAVIKALKEFPTVNAQLENDTIAIPGYVDLCIAISTSKGLMAPALRNADTLAFYQLEIAIAELARKARENKISIEELIGGTFTITNGGVFGSMMSTPIINSPQSAILGMHKIMQRPVVINGKIEIREMMYVALSYDHRVIDGKESVGFVVRIKEILENPEMEIFGNENPGEILLNKII